MLSALGMVMNEDARRVVSETFDRMEVAEEEIASAKRRYKRIAHRINRAFKILWPTPGLRMFSTELYRAHARELIERVARNEDTRPGTKAEVLAMMSRTSLDAPLNNLGMAMTMRLFRDLYPQLEHPDLADHREPWEGASDEQLAECRRKLTVEDRVMDEGGKR
jgi:hypothetical protein